MKLATGLDKSQLKPGFRIRVDWRSANGVAIIGLATILRVQDAGLVVCYDEDPDVDDVIQWEDDCLVGPDEQIPRMSRAEALAVLRETFDIPMLRSPAELEPSEIESPDAWGGPDSIASGALAFVIAAVMAATIAIVGALIRWGM